MFSRFIPTAEKIIFRHRLAVIVIFCLTTLFMAYSASHLRIDAGFTKLVPMKHEFMKTYVHYQQEFGGANKILVVLAPKKGDIFTPEFFTALQKVTDEIFFLPGVDRSRVISIFTPNARFTEVTEEGFAGGPLVAADFAPNRESLDKVRENLIKSPYVGRLVANDFTAALVKTDLLEIDPQTKKKLNLLEVAKRLENIRQKYQNDNLDIHIIGFAKVMGDITEGASRVVLFFGVAFLVTALLIYFYTLSLRRTGVLLAVALIAVIWQLGLLPLLGFGIDPMGILVPFLVFAIAVSHGIQMISANSAGLFEGKSTLDAAKDSFSALLIPGLTALGTDTIGFATIYLIKIRIIQEMAMTAGIGVAVIILTNLVLLPVILSYVTADEKYRQKLRRKAAIFEPVWHKLSAVASRPVAAVIIGICLLLALLGAWKAGDIKIGDTQAGVPELRPDSRYNRDTAFITKKFSIGVDIMTIFVDGGQPDACVNCNNMLAVDDLEWHMANIPGVHSTMSLAKFLRIANAGWNEGAPKWQILPTNKPSIASCLTFLGSSSGLMSPDGRVMPVYLFTRDHKAETISRIVAAARKYRQQHTPFGEGMKIALMGGNVGVMAATNEEVQASQTPILLYVYGAVILFCLIAFRSIRAVLCILLPLGLVSLLGYSLMAIMGIGLKVNTLPIVALGVGVGVDYGIYIYASFRSILKRGESFRKAYEKTLDITGNGVLVTAFSLAIGVATWIWSPLQFQADMGILLTFLFLVNMLGAVFVLPALAAWLLRGPNTHPAG
ncbi:MAG: RND family transporter [Deltaproteobacteria bacterium]|nr:RND family transporter [Deltaproteobacteria bacterium]